MKRVILDTNIYGELLMDVHHELHISLMLRSPHIVLYGFPLIRRELRSTSKLKLLGDHNLRIRLLELYDLLVKDHQLPETVKIAETALNYFTVYRELGGTKSKDEIESDFLIVAAASINNLDVVVSEDESTLRSELARKAYLIVNGVQKLRNPEFIGYENLKRLFSV